MSRVDSKREKTEWFCTIDRHSKIINLGRVDGIQFIPEKIMKFPLKVPNKGINVREVYGDANLAYLERQARLFIEKSCKKDGYKFTGFIVIN